MNRAANLIKQSGSDGAIISELTNKVKDSYFKYPNKAHLLFFKKNDTSAYPVSDGKNQGKIHSNSKVIFSDNSHRLIDGKYYNNVYDEKNQAKTLRNFFDKAVQHEGFGSLVLGHELLSDYVEPRQKLLHALIKSKKLSSSDKRGAKEDLKHFDLIRPNKRYIVNLN
jgi:hypothetical protein